jgi:dinuclear metal center YbgI/SA1388 family protein
VNTTIGQLSDYLESIAPLHLQEKYDNSGLIIGQRDTLIKNVLICLDVTEEIIDEALRMDCNVVVSHHPVVFYGMKKFNDANATERIVAKALKSDVAIYSIHTNLDNVLANGVNERIALTLGLQVESILKPLPGHTDLGAGIVARLPQPMAEVSFLQLLGDKMKAKVIRHTRLLGRPIQRVAICGGSGSFLLEDARAAGAQALVTADYKYHGFFEADGCIVVCDIGHYESEQFTVQLIQELISANFTTFAAHCTGIDTNPVHYFT